MPTTGPATPLFEQHLDVARRLVDEVAVMDAGLLARSGPPEGRAEETVRRTVLI
jgi:hypothetical protein